MAKKLCEVLSACVLTMLRAYKLACSCLVNCLQENSMPKKLPDGRTESPGVLRIYLSSLIILALFYACSAVVGLILRSVSVILRAVGIAGGCCHCGGQAACCCGCGQMWPAGSVRQAMHISKEHLRHPAQRRRHAARSGHRRWALVMRRALHSHLSSLMYASHYRSCLS